MSLICRSLEEQQLAAQHAGKACGPLSEAASVALTTTYVDSPRKVRACGRPLNRLCCLHVLFSENEFFVYCVSLAFFLPYDCCLLLLWFVVVLTTVYMEVGQILDYCKMFTLCIAFDILLC